MDEHYQFDPNADTQPHLPTYAETGAIGTEFYDNTTVRNIALEAADATQPVDTREIIHLGPFSKEVIQVSHDIRDRLDMVNLQIPGLKQTDIINGSILKRLIRSGVQKSGAVQTVLNRLSIDLRRVSNVFEEGAEIVNDIPRKDRPFGFVAGINLPGQLKRATNFMRRQPPPSREAQLAYKTAVNFGHATEIHPQDGVFYGHGNTWDTNLLARRASEILPRGFSIKGQQYDFNLGNRARAITYDGNPDTDLNALLAEQASAEHRQRAENEDITPPSDEVVLVCVNQYEHITSDLYQKLDSLLENQRMVVLVTLSGAIPITNHEFTDGTQVAAFMTQFKDSISRSDFQSNRDTTQHLLDFADAVESRGYNGEFSGKSYVFDKNEVRKINELFLVAYEQVLDLTGERLSMNTFLCLLELAVAGVGDGEVGQGGPVTGGVLRFNRGDLGVHATVHSLVDLALACEARDADKISQIINIFDSKRDAMELIAQVQADTPQNMWAFANQLALGGGALPSAYLGISGQAVVGVIPDMEGFIDGGVDGYPSPALMPQQNVAITAKPKIVRQHVPGSNDRIHRNLHMLTDLTMRRKLGDINRVL